MDKKLDPITRDNIKKYIEEVKKEYDLEAVIIFGSYAKGLQDKNSDIDLAIVSADIKDRYDDMAKLMGLTWGIDTRIEPHPIKLEEYELKEDNFVKEIISNGINFSF